MKSQERFRNKVRQILKRNRGISIEDYIQQLNTYLAGWTNYFHMGLYKTKSNKIDGWIRHKIRTILWKQWKTTKMRVKMQRKYATFKCICRNSRLGPYRVARRELHFSLKDEVLDNNFGYRGVLNNLETIRNKKSKLDMHYQLTLFEL